MCGEVKLRRDLIERLWGFSSSWRCWAYMYGVGFR